MILQKVLRVLIGLTALLYITLALGFLLDPAQAAARLGIGAIAPLGMATLRGDFIGFFGTIGILALLGAVRNEARYYIAPLMLVGMTLAGRLITVAASGFDATMGPPMLVEAVTVALLLLGSRSLKTNHLNA
jgi:hypothetical protein